jgi:hypothetical protein
MPIGGLVKLGGRALGQVADPTNYNFLRKAAEDVLSRTVPQGVNFGALPTQFLDTLTNIERMAPGAAKEAARNKAKTTLTRAARAQAPAPKPVGQGAGGALRAPSVGPQAVRPTPTTVAPRTNIPGSPLATDYALSRQTGMTQALGQARNAARPAAQNFLGRMMSAGGGKAGLGFDLLNPVPGIGMGGSLTSALGLGGVGGLATTVGGGLLAAGAFDAAFPQGLGPGTLDAERKRGGFKGEGTKLSPLEMRELYGGSSDMDAGPATPVRQPGRDVAPPAPQLPPPEYPNLSPQERAYQQEIARTQQMAAANPYFQQMNLYGQGQSAMQTQEDMNKVRDLGLAINRSMYGDMTTPRTPNQLMAGLTPPGPAKPVIPMDEEGRIGQLDTAAAGVQEFMRKYAEGMKKRKGEE